MQQYEFHPLANLFPIMTGDDYDELCKSVASGYDTNFPILLYDGKILDGRNRYIACQSVNAEPVLSEYNGNDPLGFVVKANLHRRHLTPGQRTAIAYEIEKEIAREAAQKEHERKTSTLEIFPKSESIHAAQRAAEIMNVNPHYVTDYKRIIEQAPELAERVKTGEMTIPEAKREIRAVEIQAQRAELARSALDIPDDRRWRIGHASIRELETIKQYDFIITDPPYPREYLPLYSILAERARKWLKPDGLLIAMCGQSYLSQIYAMFDEHLTYYWTACYLTPGQPTPLRNRQVNTTWKPLLIYGLSTDYKGKIFGDVFKSDGNDKDFHEWGQSISGMASIINQICLPGQSILDPFCGAGTTGIAALRHGCLFDGYDINDQCVQLARARLANDTRTAR